MLPETPLWEIPGFDNARAILKGSCHPKGTDNSENHSYYLKEREIDGIINGSKARLLKVLYKHDPEKIIGTVFGAKKGDNGDLFFDIILFKNNKDVEFHLNKIKDTLSKDNQSTYGLSLGLTHTIEDNKVDPLKVIKRVLYEVSLTETPDLDTKINSIYTPDDEETKLFTKLNIETNLDLYKPFYTDNKQLESVQPSEKEENKVVSDNQNSPDIVEVETIASKNLPTTEILDHNLSIATDLFTITNKPEEMSIPAEKVDVPSMKGKPTEQPTKEGDNKMIEELKQLAEKKEAAKEATKEEEDKKPEEKKTEEPKIATISLEELEYFRELEKKVEEKQKKKLAKKVDEIMKNKEDVLKWAKDNYAGGYDKFVSVMDRLKVDPDDENAFYIYELATAASAQSKRNIPTVKESQKLMDKENEERRKRMLDSVDRLGQKKNKQTEVSTEASKKTITPTPSNPPTVIKSKNRDILEEWANKRKFVSAGNRKVLRMEPYSRDLVNPLRTIKNCLPDEWKEAEKMFDINRSKITKLYPDDLPHQINVNNTKLFKQSSVSDYYELIEKM